MKRYFTIQADDTCTVREPRIFSQRQGRINIQVRNYLFGAHLFHKLLRLKCVVTPKQAHLVKVNG